MMLETCSNSSERLAISRNNTLHKFFDDAIEHYEWINSNPVRKRYRPKIYRVRPKSLTPDESMKVLLASSGTGFETAIRLGLLCGLRPCEIQALRWESVDLDKGMIYIREAFKRKIGKIEPFPKQREHGVCAIPKPLIEYLRVCPRYSAFVAAEADGEMLSYQRLLIFLKRLCAKAG